MNFISRTITKHLREAKKGEETTSPKGWKIRVKSGARGREEVEIIDTDTGDVVKTYTKDDRYTVKRKKGDEWVDVTKRKANEYIRNYLEKKKKQGEVSNPTAEKEKEEKEKRKKEREEKKKTGSKKKEKDKYYDVPKEELFKAIPMEKTKEKLAKSIRNIKKYGIDTEGDPYQAVLTHLYQMGFDRKKAKEFVEKHKGDIKKVFDKMVKDAKSGEEENEMPARTRSYKMSEAIAINAFADILLERYSYNAVRKPYLFDYDEKIIGQLVEEYNNPQAEYFRS